MKIPKNGIKVKDNSIISWNHYYYGIVDNKRFKHKEKYVKSLNSRFDDSHGETVEISADEYREVAEKYSKVFR